MFDKIKPRIYVCREVIVIFWLGKEFIVKKW